MMSKPPALRGSAASRPEPTQVFYAAPAAVARILCALFVLAVAAIFALQFLTMPAEEAKASLFFLLPLFGVGVLTEIVLAFVLSRLFPVRLNDAGITIQSFWGRRRHLSWEEIKTVQAGKCLSAPYLRISSGRETHTELILTLEVTCPLALLQSVQYYTSPRNPLRRFLERDR